jgi:hypothetical protein
MPLNYVERMNRACEAVAALDGMRTTEDPGGADPAHPVGQADQRNKYGPAAGRSHQYETRSTALSYRLILSDCSVKPSSLF